MNRKTFKVSEIVELANKTYSLYGLSSSDLDDIRKTKFDTYSKQVRQVLKKEFGFPKEDPNTHKKTYNRVSPVIAHSIINYFLKNYFIKNSNNEEIFRQDIKLNKGVNKITDSLKDSYKEIGDENFEKEKEQFISSLKDFKNDPSPVKRVLPQYLNRHDNFYGALLQLDSALSQLKQDYIFSALLDANKQTFDQKAFIKDFFERYNHIDDNERYFSAKPGYSIYNSKLTNPLNPNSDYIKDNK